MKVEVIIPTEQFGNIKFIGEEDELDKIIKYYNKYSNNPIKENQGTFEEIQTFTGATIRYNKETHEYTDLDHNVLLSGSAFAKSKTKPFMMAMLSGKVGNKYGYDAKEIEEVWGANGNCSAQFGTAIHLALENFFRYRHINTGDKKYYLPKPEFLRTAVETFPLNDGSLYLPELMIADIMRGWCGQADLLEVVDMEKKIAVLWDYKSDIELTKEKLEKYAWQLSFYASIFEAAGWTITDLKVANYVNKWTIHQIERKEV